MQSQQEVDFGERMFVYYYRLFDRYNRKVASFAILGDDCPTWRPDRFHSELWGTDVGFRFATAKLLDYADESVLASDRNPFAVVVLAHLQTLATAHDDEARRVWLVRLVKGLYERGFNAEQIRHLYRLIDTMMSLPTPLAELAWDEIRVFEKEKDMPLISTAERVGREAGLAEGLEQGLEQGLEKGLEKGREEGLEQGLEQGLEKARESLLSGIELGLDLKFAATGLAILPEIREIRDVALLNKILRSIKTASSADELRTVWRQP